ncbi:MAG: TonB-dependent receptor plug domain-containing protein [Chthoniobacterales bacterium]
MKTLGILRVALVAAVGLPFVLTTSAFAQGTEATTERVTVTGSYIPTAEEVTASPLDTVTSQDVNRSGQQDVLTTLQTRNPDFVGAGNLGNTNANIAAGSTLGGSVIQIRGLPTLVLFENRRIADSAAISIGSQFTDVNLFPTALISKIEVLKDGASALYGSDAIGGVVNIFLKDDFRGAELGFRYGTAVEEAVAERRGYAIAGVGNDTTQVMVGMQYYEIDPLFERQRAFSIIPGGVTTTYGGVGRDNQGGGTKFYLMNGTDPLNYSAIGINSPFNVGVVPGSIAPPPFTGANPGQYALIPQAYTQVPQATITSFDLSRIPNSTLDQQRTNINASMSHQIFGKQLELFGNVMYANNHSESFLNAQPLSNGTGVIILGSQRVNPNFDPSMPATPNLITGPGTNPQLILEDRGAPAMWNPFQESIDSNTLSGRYRLFANQRYQTNPRIFTQTANFYRFLGGLRSQITPDWFFESAAFYSRYDIQFINRNLVNANVLNAMIAGRDLDGNAIPALDFFARQPVGTGPNQISQEQFDTIFGSNVRTLDSFQRVFDAKIVGFPFSLPAGKVGVTVGGEYRVEGFKVADSPEIFVGSTPIGQINVKRDIESFFTEIQIPIVSSAMHVPGIYNLELDLAGRYDHYQGVSEDAKVPKVGLRYQPIPDLTLRSTFSNSFVAPNLFQTNGPAGTGFTTTIDLGFGPEDQAQVMSGSNPDLVPSTAQAITAGLVYSPKFVPGLTISADYFRTLQQLIVSTLGSSLILNSVEQNGTASPYANLVAFNNFPGQPGAHGVTGPGQLHGNLASVFVVDTNQNIGAISIEGWDLSARYNMDLRTWGQLELGINAVVFTRYDQRTTPQSKYFNLQGLDFTEGGGGIPDYKLTFLLEYRLGGLTYSANANYIPELRNAIGQDVEFGDQSTFDVIDDYFSVNMRLSYEFGKGYVEPTAPVTESKDGKSTVAGAATTSWYTRLLNGTTLAVGCNNIFDADPPFVAGANSATDLSLYDGFGRFVYFEISKKF